MSKDSLAYKLHKLYNDSFKIMDSDTKFLIKRLTKLCKNKAKRSGKEIVWYTNLPFNKGKLMNYFVNQGCGIDVFENKVYCGKSFNHCIRIDWECKND